jgi:hypothetical protein
MKNSYQHNGGTWSRPDIPTATPCTWNCCICNKTIDCKQEYYYQKDNSLANRYYPLSKYWNGQGTEIFCSIECSFDFYEKHQL